MTSVPSKKTVITENPPLRVRDLVAPRSGPGLFLEFYGKDASLFYFGRGALWQAVGALGLCGSDTVLVPSYHCGVEIEAVALSGVRLAYYDIRADLTVDLAELRSRIEAGTRAVLLIHYFGFPQPVEEVKAICQARGIVLIEDCSQALFSCYRGQPLGTFGDLASFSQRKTLPLPDGGALLVNNPALSCGEPASRPSGGVVLKKTAGMLFRSLFNCDPRNELPYPLERLAALFNRRLAQSSAVSYSTGMEIDPGRCRLASSGLSRHIMERTRIEQVISRRRDNYALLSARLPEQSCFKAVRDSLPEGVCPLFFPIRVEGMPRGEFQDRLLARGIGSFIFGDQSHPSLPKGLYPGARALADSILCLPVHQGLGPKDMERIAKSLQQITGERFHADTH
jgi:perosamine synthetase